MLQRDGERRAPAAATFADLPGAPLGPHDSILLQDGNPYDPIETRLQWVHHSSGVMGSRTGETCSEDGLAAHAVLVDSLDGLSLTPSVTCTTCGRTGWITEGKFIPSGSRLEDRRVT